MLTFTADICLFFFVFFRDENVFACTIICLETVCVSACEQVYLLKKKEKTVRLCFRNDSKCSFITGEGSFLYSVLERIEWKF